MARGGYRPGSGPQKGTKYRPRATREASGDEQKQPRKRTKPPVVPKDITDEAAAEGMTPLDYMLKVMRSKEVDPGRRDRMAIAAAPFVHPRKGEGSGKKQDKDDRAKAAGKGKFAPSAPPKLAVVNK